MDAYKDADPLDYPYFTEYNPQTMEGDIITVHETEQGRKDREAFEWLIWSGRLAVRLAIVFGLICLILGAVR